MPAIFVEDLSCPALEKFLQSCDTAVIPVASIETHGPHLSLCADPLVAEGMLRRAAPLIDADVLILPMIHYAIVCQHGFERKREVMRSVTTKLRNVIRSMGTASLCSITDA